MKLFLLDEIRTNNVTDQEVMSKIGEVWEKMESHPIDPQKNKYGIYFKYASNYKGDYSMATGTEYLETENILETKSDTKYKVFPVNMKRNDPILLMWQKIWEMEDNGQLSRAYKVDFEKYLPNGEVDIYISVLE